AELGGGATGAFAGLEATAPPPPTLAPRAPVFAAAPPIASPTPQAPAAISATRAPAAPPAPAVAAVVAAAPPDPARGGIDVLAEKTGYPAEMLGLDLEMEAGLGIDSIKQVEILSALRERLPGLPEISPAELARLRTLRDVAARLSPGASAGSPPATPRPPANVP